MATHVYRADIYIHADGSTGGGIGSGGAKNSAKAHEDAKQASKAAAMAGGDKVTSIAKWAVLAGYAKRFASTIVTGEIGRVGIATGNSRLQAQIAFGYSFADDAASMTQSVLAGLIMTGGNPAGAIVGAVTSLAFKGISIAEQQANLNMSRAVETVGRNQTYIRAGAGAGRIGRED